MSARAAGRSLGVAALLGWGGTTALGAQLPQLPRLTGPALLWRGEMGTYGELYHTSAAIARRPGETGRFFLNSTATLFGHVTVGVNLLLSSEDGLVSTAGFGGLPGRQRVSQFGLHPEWGWGRADIGTFSGSYTPYTWNGVRVTGLGFEVNPGLLRLAAFGGQARSAVDGGAPTGSFTRGTVGGRVGIGRRTSGRPGTYFDVVVVRAWDNVSSLPVPVDTALPPNSPAALAANPFAVTPQDNLVVSGAGGLALFDRRLSWRGEVAGSVLSPDRRASPLATGTLGGYPGFLRGLVTPRVGTHADYAYSTELQLRLPRLPGASPTSPRTLTATLGLRYVGPGYATLGAASLPNDQQAIDLKTTIRFARWSLQAHGLRQNDNLIGQKLATTVRRRVDGTFTFQAGRAWTVSARGSYLTMGNGLQDNLSRIAYSTWSFGASQSISFGPRRRWETLSLNYNYQRAGDANPLRASSAFVAHTADLSAGLRMSAALTLTPSLGFARSWAGSSEPATRATYGISAAWRAMGGRLSSTASLSRTRYSRTHAWTGSASARYALTAQDALSLSLQLNRFSDTATPLNGYNEQLMILRWTHQL
jgi:hypothetical protein